MSAPFVNEKIEPLIEGEIQTYSITWLGASSVSSTSAIVYRNGADVTSTVMPSGSNSQSGIVSTFKPVNALSGDGGTKYVIEGSATVDGNTEKRRFIVDVLTPGDEQS